MQSINPSNHVWREISLKQFLEDFDNGTQNLAMGTSPYIGMLKHYKVNILTEGINLEWKTLRDRVENQFLTLEAWRSKNSRWRGGGFPWRRRTMVSHLAFPREV
jgi:hypothetical protein